MLVVEAAEAVVEGTMVEVEVTVVTPAVEDTKVVVAMEVVGEEVAMAVVAMAVDKVATAEVATERSLAKALLSMPLFSTFLFYLLIHRTTHPSFASPLIILSTCRFRPLAPVPVSIYNTKPVY